MSKPTTATIMINAKQVVIWQPYIEDRGPGDPALLVQSDSTGLLSITKEGREVLIQPETLPELLRQLRRLAGASRL